MGDGIVNLAQREMLHLRRDIMPGGEIQHRRNSSGASVGDPEILFCPEIRSKAPTGIGSRTAPTKCMRPLGLSVRKNALQSSGTFAVTSRKSSEFAAFRMPGTIPAGYHPMCTEFSHFFHLLTGSRKRRLPRNPRHSQIEGPCPPQPPDAYHTYPVRWFHLVDSQGRKHRNAATQQRTGRGNIERFRQGNCPGPMRTHLFRKTPAMADDCRNCSSAEMMIASHALMAMHATGAGPSDPDTLADPESLDLIARGHDAAHRLMAWHDRILGQPPIVVKNGKIGVAIGRRIRRRSPPLPAPADRHRR